MASLKAQMSMLHRIQTNIGTGKLGTIGKWNTPEKREAGIIQATTTWENHVKALRWPKSRRKPSTDPKVWTFGTSVGDWRSLNFAHPQSIRQRCIVLTSVSSSVHPLVADGRNGRSGHPGLVGRKLRLPGNKANGNWPLAPFWARGT